MNYYTDTHAHIYLNEFKQDREDMLKRSNEAEVKKIFMPNVDHTSIDLMLEAEEKNKGRCIAMMGLHPCSVDKDFEKRLYEVEAWLGKRRFSAVGEIGTDLYWDKTFWEQQKEALTIQVGWAKKFGLPLVIHCRESLDETIQLLRPLVEGLTGIFHCFTGTQDQARQIVDLGFYLGIGGVVTFKNGGLDSVLPQVKLGRMVLETDSPYLAPVPYRGKRNEPSYIPLIAGKIAAIMKIEVSEVMTVTTNNAIKIFGDTYFL